MENHSDISKNFIPYELALELKELGFDEECLALYQSNHNNKPFININNKINIEALLSGKIKNEGIQYLIKAPLWQQAFDWFRKIGYETSILRTPPEMVGKGKIKKYSYFIWKEDDNPRGNQGFEDTYEKAREKCLEKLIEIVSNKIEK